MKVIVNMITRRMPVLDIVNNNYENDFYEEDYATDNDDNSDDDYQDDYAMDNDDNSDDDY